MTSTPQTSSRTWFRRPLAGLLAVASVALAAAGVSGSDTSTTSPAPPLVVQAGQKTPTKPAAGKPADISPMFDESKLRRRTKPISCGAGQNSTVGGILLEVEGVAVTVGTGCNMRLRGSIIVGGDTAIVVQTGGNLWLDRSDVQSRDVSLKLESGANAYVSGSLMTGRLVKGAGANLSEKGTNTWK
jgi:hypothetical protein